MNVGLLIPLIIYLLIMIGLGFYANRGSTDREGFLLAGRGLGAWVMSLSYAFSGMSSYVLVTFVGIVVVQGPSSFWILIGFNVGFTLAYLLIGRRIRNYSQLLGAVTYAEYYRKRVRQCGGAINLIVSIIIVLMMSVYVASQLIATGKTAQAIFGIPSWVAVLIAAVVVLVYCIAGGFKAVSLTDFIQGLLILIGMIITACILLSMRGGLGNVMQENIAIHPDWAHATYGKAGMAFIGTALGWITSGLSLIGRPHDTIRFFAIKNSGEIRKAYFSNMLALSIVYWMALVIAMAGNLFFPDLQDGELLFGQLVSTVLPPVIGGGIMVVFMGLMMSTIDSQLFSASSTFVNDVLNRFSKKDVKEKSDEQKEIRNIQICMVVVSILAIIIALAWKNSPVLRVTQYASAGMAGVFCAPLILSLYWKKLTGPGTVAGMICGFAAAVISMHTVYKIHSGWPVGVAILVGFVVTIVVSLVTKNPYEDEIAKELEQIKKEF